MAKNKSYWGPAGIFSTDDFARDQRMIDAENSDEKNGVELDQNQILFICNSGWEFVLTFPDTIDKIDYGFTNEIVQGKHDLECDCGQEIDYILPGE